MLLALLLALLTAQSYPRAPVDRAEDRQHPYDAFGTPERVEISGWTGDAMEPFVTRDGRFLLFNNRNDPPEQTDLHYAEASGGSFSYRGPIAGSNSATLDGVPSVDRDGVFYFVSTRAYASTLDTIFRGQFIVGSLAEVGAVAGVSLRRPGWVNFDAEISADGNTLWIVDGHFDSGPVPSSADIVVADREGTAFRRRSDSASLLRNVNTRALEYAPGVSADGRELYFTRLAVGATASPGIYRAVRSSATAPFDPPARVSGIDGFVEAPALSPDGLTLYFHRLESDNRFAIYRARRPPVAAARNRTAPPS